MQNLEIEANLAGVPEEWRVAEAAGYEPPEVGEATVQP